MELYALIKSKHGWSPEKPVVRELFRHDIILPGQHSLNVAGVDLKENTQLVAQQALVNPGDVLLASSGYTIRCPIRGLANRSETVTPGAHFIRIRSDAPLPENAIDMVYGDIIRAFGKRRLTLEKTLTDNTRTLGKHIGGLIIVVLIYIALAWLNGADIEADPNWKNIVLQIVLICGVIITTLLLWVVGEGLWKTRKSILKSLAIPDPQFSIRSNPVNRESFYLWTTQQNRAVAEAFKHFGLDPKTWTIAQAEFRAEHMLSLFRNGFIEDRYADTTIALHLGELCQLRSQFPEFCP